MSNLTQRVRNAGFIGTTQEFETVQADIVAALQAVDDIQPAPQTRVAMVNVLSTADVSGTAAAPVVDLIWTYRPIVYHSPLAYEAVTEAALLSGVANVTVAHNGTAGAFGVADFGALATGLGL